METKKQMSHARSLRVIGHALDTANVGKFQLETDGQNYIVKNFSSTEAGNWLLQRGMRSADHALLLGLQQSAASGVLDFRPSIIASLDEQGRKQRRGDSYPLAHEQVRLSHLLRSIGDFLDRKEASEFQIDWTTDAIFVEFESPGHESDLRKFTLAKLQKLSALGRFQRFHRARGSAFSRRH